MLVMLSDCCFGGWVLLAKCELMLMMLDGGLCRRRVLLAICQLMLVMLAAGAASEFLKQSAS